ncbi:hypothetical protein NL676_010806 [Syzygium grande]|nr:hypothetical protein NL676_010806 [Syzygium grande]
MARPSAPGAPPPSPRCLLLLPFSPSARPVNQMQRRRNRGIGRGALAPPPAEPAPENARRGRLSGRIADSGCFEQLQAGPVRLKRAGSSNTARQPPRHSGSVRYGPSGTGRFRTVAISRFRCPSGHHRDVILSSRERSQ